MHTTRPDSKLETSAPLFNTIAEDGPLSDFAAASVLQQLLDYAERQTTYVVLLPEHVLLGGNGDVQVMDQGLAAGTLPENSVFVAPEAANGEASTASDAYVWNLGIFLYVLLSGYQPFASSTSKCPFYMEFVTSKQLTCPPHFSTQAITLLCGMIVVSAESRMSLPDIRAECMTWMMRLLKPAVRQPTPPQPSKAEPKPKHKRAVEYTNGGSGSISALERLRQLSVGDRLAQQSSQPSAAPTADPALTDQLQEDPSLPSPGSSELDDSPATQPRQRRDEGAAAAWALREAMPPPPEPERQMVVGPHGAAHASVRKGLVAHPNSPISMTRGLREQAGLLANRPIAVIYSPDSSLPRKVAAEVALQWSSRTAVGPIQSARKAQVRRLGWDIRFEEGAEALLFFIADALKPTKAEFDICPGEQQQVSMVTRLTSVSDAMGIGRMQASISVSWTGAQPNLFRVNVSRHSGDTFQFHAFYRELRANLKPIILRNEENHGAWCA